MKKLTLLVICMVLGSINSKPEGGQGSGGTGDHVAPPQGSHPPQGHIVPSPESQPPPATQPVNEHVQGAGDGHSIKPAPAPLPDNSYWSRLKGASAYPGHIENIQKSSSEMYENLYKFLLQNAGKTFPDVKAFKMDDEDYRAKLKQSFDKFVGDVSAMSKQRASSDFKHTLEAISRLKDGSQGEEQDKDKMLRKSLAMDIKDNIMGYFPIPGDGWSKAQNWWNNWQKGAGAKEEKKDLSKSVDSHSTSDHHEHPEVVHNTSEHHEHIKEKSIEQIDHHEGSRNVVDSSHSKHDNETPKEKHIQPSNSMSSGSSSPESNAQNSVLDNIIDAVLYVIPVHRAIKWWYSS